MSLKILITLKLCRRAFLTATSQTLKHMDYTGRRPHRVSSRFELLCLTPNILICLVFLVSSYILLCLYLFYDSTCRCFLFFFSFILCSLYPAITFNFFNHLSAVSGYPGAFHLSDCLMRLFKASVA